MRPRLLLLAALGGSVLPGFAQAHFLWATLDAGQKTVAVGLQELPSEQPVPLGERVPRVKAWGPSAKSLPLQREGNWLKAATAEPCVGVALDYGVLDKRDQGRGVFWLNYFAKAAATPADSRDKLGLPVELSVRPDESGRFVVTVLNAGKPAQGAEVVVERPGGGVAFTGYTQADGTVALPAPEGPFAVRGLVTDERKGTHDGKAYDLVRSYCTLTVGTPAAFAKAAAPSPLMRRFSEAFGRNHTVVGRTAFVQGLMARKLTKAQIDDHFQQRALIHQEVDRVLRAAALPVYGERQKEVVDLLRADMAAYGTKWPEEAQAWPLTKALIDEIRASEKQGPYFALGVLHVYYGGITHGGRDIGAIIGEILKTAPPTYYLKSDGYDDYAKRINEITDPRAQSEAIRGGVEAYKYIIASNDDPSFKK
jgi:hypothetical protein